MKQIFLLFSLLSCLYARADEGIWLPSLLQKNQADMQGKGMLITTDDIYRVNQACLKDAVVKFGRGCTGEFISSKGLLLTNHHCGYGQIQSLSSLEKDYLQKGFWAMSPGEELPCPGLSVSLLQNMEEVTEKVLAGLRPESSEGEASRQRKENIRQLLESLEKKEGYSYEVAPFYNGLQYFLLTHKVYTDVRLVGAPPSSVGKFGSDSDNWMWPRHTGDFSLFRVYANANNEPAAYSPSNQAYQPLQHLRISLQGVNEGDFTFVMGYPGRTQEYLSSYGVRMAVEVENPIRIQARSKRLDILNKAMSQNPLTRIQYSAKVASIANGWKKWQGEIKGVKRMKGVEKKQAFEKDFQPWADTAADGRFKEVLRELADLYAELEAYAIQDLYFNEHVLAPEIVKWAYAAQTLVNIANDPTGDPVHFDQEVERLKKRIPEFYKNFDPEVDKKIFIALSEIQEKGAVVRWIDFPDKNFPKYVEEMYRKSFFTDAQKYSDLLEKLTINNAAKMLSKDPLLYYAQLAHQMYLSMVQPIRLNLVERIDRQQRNFMEGQLLYASSRPFYPDANSTLRVAYGKVSGYSPADGVNYHYQTTLDGMMAKEDSLTYDYLVDPRLKKVFLEKDFGAYALADGRLPLAFIASNHTTGGNSGSPVLNAQGHLIGLNFDRNWEGVMSDLMYDPNYCRNISLDIRFCLFYIEKVAGAKHLIQEMEVVR